MTEESKPKISGKQNLMGDLIFILLFFGVYVTAYFIFQGFLKISEDGFFLIPWILFSFFLSLVLWGRILPRPRPGKYKLGSKGALLWYLTLLFGRIWGNPAIRFLLFSNSFTRTIFLKACGAKISFTHTCSPYVEIHDPSLIEVEDGVVFGMHSKVLGHYIVGGHLILGTVHIGANSLIGAACAVAPGAVIGRNVLLEVGVQIFPKTKIPDNCHVSRHSIITKHVELKEGERVPPHSNYDK